MKRPPRKKPGTRKGELNRDPRFDPDALRSAPDLAQDDRNLVGVDDAFKEADVEDKVWLFWQRNKNTLIGLSVAAIFAVILSQGYGLYRTYQQHTLQSAYLEAVTAEERLAFGRQNPDSRLGGLALLEAADAAYLALDYTQAASLYTDAGRGLRGLPFAARADLGRAMALIKGGQEASGKTVLTRLADDPSVLVALRSEAAFQLALLALGENQPAEADKWLKRIDQFPDNEIWQQQAQMLRRTSPSLKAEVTPPAQADS